MHFCRCIILKDMEDIIFKFICKRENCEQQCCSSFEGFSQHLRPIESRFFSEIILTSVDIKALTDNGFSKYIYTKKDGNSYLKTTPTGICCAYTNGNCAINDFKPTICKAYPFYLDMFSGLCAIRNCPGISYQETAINDYKNELNSLLDIYEHWIKYYRTLIESTNK